MPDADRVILIAEPAQIDTEPDAEQLQTGFVSFFRWPREPRECRRM
jgi:hypothetical protein